MLKRVSEPLFYHGPMLSFFQHATHTFDDEGVLR